MRIGLVTACYHPVINGVTQMVSMYRRHLSALGHEVTVFTLGQGDANVDEPQVIRSPALPFIAGYHLSWGYSHQAQVRLRQMDIVHCHHPLMGVDLAARYSNCPIVYTNHTRYDLYADIHVPLPQSLNRLLLRQLWPRLTALADVVVTPSAKMRQVLRAFGVLKSIEVIANGIDLEPFLRPSRPLTKRDFGLAESAILYIYVGRLSPEKSVTELLAQFALAQRSVSGLHLVMLGSGRERERLDRMVAQLGLGDCIHFVGAVDPEAVPNYLAVADIFVTASASEVQPLSIIEAMAAGLSIVAPRAAGLDELIESGKTGLLASETSAGLATAIVALGRNEALRRRLGCTAQTASEQFDIRHTVAQSLALYERLARMYSMPNNNRPAVF